MLRRYSQNPDVPNRAQQTYLILIGLARNGKTTTYGEVAAIMGNMPPIAVSYPLKHIMYWCRERELPSITELVLSADRKLPSGGVTPSAQHESEKQKIFEFNWYDVIPPTTEELRQAYTAGVARPEEGQ